MSSKYKIIIVLLFLSGLYTLGCNELGRDNGVVGLRTMAALSATINTTATVELDGLYLALKVASSGQWGCSYDGATDDFETASTVTSGEIIDALTDFHANSFTTPSYMNVTGAELKIRRSSGPSGNMFTMIKSASGLDPSGTALATSANVLMTDSGTSPTGSLITFTMASPVELTSTTAYFLEFNPQTDATIDGANNVRWLSSNNTGPDGCTSFPVYRFSSNSGGTWSAGNNLTYRRNFFNLIVDVHATSGNASWIATGYLGGSWDMSTFAFSENPNGLTSGTITYDVGVGSSSTVPSYTSTDLTKAQVLALADPAGEYLYLKANLSVGAPAYNKAVLGDGSIVAY